MKGGITLISDIIDLYKTIRDISDSGLDIYADDLSDANKNVLGLMRNGSKRTKSIKARANDSLLQFPMLVSDSIDPQTTLMLSKALEAQYSYFVKLAITGNDVIDLTSKENKITFVNQIHSNINSISPTGNETTFSSFGTGSGVSESRLPIEIEKSMITLNEQYLKDSNDDLNSKSLNDMYFSRTSLLAEDKHPKYKKKLDPKYIKDLDMGSIPDKDRAKMRAEKDRVEQVGYMMEKKKRDEKESTSGKKHNSVKNIEINEKKVNDLQPTILTVNVNYYTGSSVENAELVVGVKTVTHYIDSQDFMYYAANSVKENSAFFRSIQWRTGEINFFKDFLLNLDTVKDRATSHSYKRGKNPSTRWFSKLDQLARMNRLRGFFNKKKFIPSATMIMSMDEVFAVRENFGVDLMEPYSAKTMMDNFLLINFIIADVADEVVYMFNEDLNIYEVYSFNALKKAAKGDASSIVSLLTASK